MTLSDLLSALAIAVGVGLIIGLQRERSGSRLAGVRTFPLVGALGVLATAVGLAVSARPIAGAVVGPAATIWLVASGLLAVASFAVIANVILMRSDPGRSPGTTTEVALVVMYLLGAYAVVGPPEAVAAVGVGVAILLHAKETLHRFSDRLGESDMRAILLFGAIAFIALPVLPDRPMGPYGVLNPRSLWLMVVLVVAISLCGYVAYKLVGAKRGALVAGLLGGLVSSTATTAAMARRARERPEAAHVAAGVISLACCVVYGRLMAEVLVAAPSHASAIVPYLAAMGLAGLLGAAFAFRLAWADGHELPPPGNPTQLAAALGFAALYAAVLVAAAWAHASAPAGGIYAVAAVSGLTDLDAITLSLSGMVESGSLTSAEATRGIAVACAANTIVKLVMAWVIGGRRVGLGLLAFVAATILASAGVVLFA